MRLPRSARLLAWPVSATLLLFNVRRLFFLLAAAYDLWASAPGVSVGPCAGNNGLQDPPRPVRNRRPHVLVLVPLRDEASSLSHLLEALLSLDYPPDCMSIGLIDDGSGDATGSLLDASAEAHEHVAVLHNPRSLGKADALNAGLRRWPQGEIVVVYDADARPEPSSLKILLATFEDPRVAAAGGMIRPANALSTPVATYSALERLVHQQVTGRAKDRLGLAPAILGSNCAYRRRDLEAAEGFPGGALLEDSQLTVDLARRGRSVRFLPAAVATDRVPETLGGYWRQHVRWGRGFHDVAQSQAGGRRQRAGEAQIPGLLRLELWMFSLGYLDRLALLLGTVLLAVAPQRSGAAGWRRPLAVLVGANLALPYLQMGLALRAERAPAAWWLRLPLVPIFFAVDLAAAVWSLLLSLARRPRMWQPTERPAGA